MSTWHELTSTLLTSIDSTVEILLDGLDGASLLWVSPGASSTSPEESLLQRVAVAATSRSASPRVVGRVDRYGGSGIGSNGGAGRGATVNGLYLKGIGPTPLIGKGSHISHSSGGAYLEECARELALSGVLSAELPYGAVLPACIVARTEKVTWQTPDGPKHESCAILARKPFIRPAHFVRANGYEPAGGPDEFAADCRRVEVNLQLARDALGDDSFIATLEDCFAAAAHQFAYASAWKLALGGVSLSNIDLNARIVDFGGVASMPCWGAFAESAGGPLSNSGLSSLVAAVELLFSDMRRYSSMPEQKISDATTRSRERVTENYRYRLRIEILRILGFTERQAGWLLASGDENVLPGIERIVSKMARYSGDLESSWSTSTVKTDDCHERLVTACANLLASNGFGGRDEVRYLAMQRQMFRNRPRSVLGRDQLKSRLYLALDRDGLGCDRGLFSEVIRSLVVEARRDLKHEFEDAHEVGVAASASDYVLTYKTADGELRRVVEPSPV